MPRPLERRRSYRIKVCAFVTIETRARAPHADLGLGSTCDLSNAGIRVRLHRPPRAGQRVRLRLAIGDEIHKCDAIVTSVRQRSKGHFDVGLDWSLCSPAELAFRSEFIRLRRSQR